VQILLIHKLEQRLGVLEIVCDVSVGRPHAGPAEIKMVKNVLEEELHIEPQSDVFSSSIVSRWFFVR
jgi:hypothetical protein